MVQASSPFDPARSDAIRPVYSLETAIEIGVAGIVGGVGAVARAGVGAVLRQVVPRRNPVAEQPQPTLSTKPLETTESLGKTAEPKGSADALDRSKPPTAPRSLLPATPDELLGRGWIEESNPEAAEKGHREFFNPETGEKLSLIKAIQKSQVAEKWITIIAVIQTPQTNGIITSTTMETWW